MFKKYLSVFLTIFFVFFSSHLFGLNPDDLIVPRASISDLKKIIKKVRNVLNDSKLKSSDRTQERREKVIKVIKESVNSNEMSKLTLGKYWYNLSDQEKKEFNRLFIKQFVET